MTDPGLRRAARTKDGPRPILAPPPRYDPVEIEGREAVPVTLLIGFLGAGKTTLLNRILNGDHGLRVGILVNDFGAINIDAELVDGVEENTISLSNGCVCCQIRDDLVASLEQLLSRVESIDYVILEASGVADPEGIVMTFLDHKYKRLLRLDSITCIVDAEAVFSDGDNEALNTLKMRQIGFSDLVVLNKVDLVGSEHVAVIREWIDHHIRRIRIIEATRCDVPLEVLLAVGRFDPAHAVALQADADSHAGHVNGDSSALPANHNDADDRAGGRGHRHGTADDMFETWSYESERPFSVDALREMVRRELPATVYRCKGIVFAAESPERRCALQAVGRRVEIEDLGHWGERTPQTRLVAIGRSFDPEELDRKFESCIVQS